MELAEKETKQKSSFIMPERRSVQITFKKECSKGIGVTLIDFDALYFKDDFLIIEVEGMFFGYNKDEIMSYKTYITKNNPNHL
jgi:hypothetical protein